jgi:hypothetical protein
MTSLFTFTRDAESCFEINSDEFRSNDPSLSDYGMQVALHFSDKLSWLGNPDQSNKDLTEQHIHGSVQTHAPLVVMKTPTMYVSCLVRSWMTAICLMRNFERATLKISKHLKNEHLGLGVIKQGTNFPESYAHQVERLYFFLSRVQHFLNVLTHITIELDEPYNTLLVRFEKRGNSWKITEETKRFVYPREYLFYRENGIREFIQEKKEKNDTFHVVCHTKQMIHFVRNYDENADLRSRPAEGRTLEERTESFQKRKTYWEQLYTLVVQPEESVLNIWRIQGDLPPKSWKDRKLKYNTLCVEDNFPTVPFKSRVLGEPLKEFVLPKSYTRYVPNYVQIGETLFSNNRPPLTTPVFDPVTNKPTVTENTNVESGKSPVQSTRKKWRGPFQIVRDWWKKKPVGGKKTKHQVHRARTRREKNRLSHRS